MQDSARCQTHQLLRLEQPLCRMQTLYETRSNVAEAHFEAIDVEDVGLVSISVLSACPHITHSGFFLLSKATTQYYASPDMEH